MISSSGDRLIPPKAESARIENRLRRHLHPAAVTVEGAIEPSVIGEAGSVFLHLLIFKPDKKSVAAMGQTPFPGQICRNKRLNLLFETDELDEKPFFLLHKEDRIP